ncbi:MAG: SARP family transcriptional regulator [Acidimicrobiia bacterium]|nr:SARP family transcriptional regulator [Acidimicrobiia bacterium]
MNDAGRSAPPCPSLRLLGAWGLTIGELPVAIQPGAQRLLALLALQGRQARSFVAGTLFPEVGEEQALGRLRSTLSRLNRCRRGLLDTTEGCLGIAPGISVDADQLLRAARALVSDDADLDQGASYGLIDAGELLPGWYDDWVLVERDRLTALRIQALERLADRALAAGRTSLALEAALAAVKADPLRESAHRSVIAVHLAESNPVAALRQYDVYVQLLRTELGLDRPSEQMCALVGRLRDPGIVVDATPRPRPRVERDTART